MKTNYKMTKLAIAVAAICLPASLVLAAENDLDEETADAGEVMVTIGKREQSINEVGITATAFDGDILQDLSIDSAVDLGAFTPGLVTVNATSGGTPIFAIRGIGLDDFNSNNSSGVGVYTDEVFASSPAYLGGQLFDIERVEVLKGPQGTLYGKNTTGGAINFITVKPSDEFEAFVEAGYSSYQTFEMTSAVGGAISDTINGRLSLNYVNSGEGWQKDINTGNEYGTQDTFALRGQLGFELGNEGYALLRVYYSKDESTPVSPNGEGFADVLLDPSFSALDSPSEPDLVSVGGLDVHRDENGSGISLTVNYAFESFDLKSITSGDNYDRDVTDNYDGTAAAAGDLFSVEDLSQWAQEIRFTSNSDGDFNWIAGISVSHEKIKATSIFDDSFLVTDSASIDFFLSNPADIDAAGLDTIISDYTQETDSLGIYLNTETQLADSWKFIAGARFSSDDKSFDGVATLNSFGDILPVAELNESQKENQITGKIGLDWTVDEDLLLYGNVATSYKGGVYYGGAIIQDSSWGYLKPEEIFSTELGFKWSMLDGTMHINGSIYSMVYENRQSAMLYVAEVISNDLGFALGDASLATIPESETKGFEMDLNWRPNDNWMVQLGIANLDTEITKSPTIADLRGINPDASVNDDAFENGFGFVNALFSPIEVGASLTQSPEWTYNGMVAYEFEATSDYYVRIQTSYSHTGSQFALLSDPNALYDATNSLNALISIESLTSNNDWKVTLWGRNISDNDSETYSFSGFAGRSVYRQQPATYGITFRYEY